MLTVKIRVRYEGDWTEALSSYDVFAKFIATTFHYREYIGLVAIVADDNEFDEVVNVIQSHDNTTDVEVTERYSAPEPGRTAATLVVRGEYLEYTPLQILLHQGYFPHGGFGELTDGYMEYDVLMEDRDELSDTVALLDHFGSVQLEHISGEFQRRITPSTSEWNELFQALPGQQRHILSVAHEHGYFEQPRQTTHQELADDIGIAKTTVSHHLRQAEQSIMSFLIPYLNLAQTGGE